MVFKSGIVLLCDWGCGSEEGDFDDSICGFYGVEVVAMIYG